MILLGERDFNIIYVSASASFCIDYNGKIIIIKRKRNNKSSRQVLSIFQCIINVFRKYSPDSCNLGHLLALYDFVSQIDFESYQK